MGKQNQFDLNAKFEYYNYLLPHLLFAQDSLSKDFPGIDLKLLILKILNQKVS